MEDRFVHLPQGLESSAVLLALIKGFEKAPYLSAFWTCPSHSTNNHPPDYRTLDWILGIGLADEDADPEPKKQGLDFRFEDFEHMLRDRPGFRMGYFGYDLKAQSLSQPSPLPPATADPDPSFWFRPRILVRCIGSRLEFLSDEQSQGRTLLKTWLEEPKTGMHTRGKTELQGCRLRDKLCVQTTEQDYEEQIATIRERIRDGDFYELNFCIEWAGKVPIQDPVALWKQLTTKAGGAFSALIKNQETWVISASPERFLRKDGERLLSQPIKGTAPRSTNPRIDLLEAEALKTNIKENAEHLMIVDLVRNDLARCADPCSVQVDDLMGCYAFPAVHHLVSSISATTTPDQSLSGILNACFPMGSMTGAPKEAVCAWIDRLEKTRRGIYSGSAGWFDPEGNFDLNVIIRSLVYDQRKGWMSLKTGGAITWDSDARTEWQECQTKAKALLDLEI